MSTTSTYTVSGMTCSHCVASVTEEVTKIAGVTDVQVDLPTGAVTVASHSPVDDAAVKDALEEAGYELVNA
jgi:copper ion binding protein